MCYKNMSPSVAVLSQQHEITRMISIILTNTTGEELFPQLFIYIQKLYIYFYIQCSHVVRTGFEIRI